MISQIPPATWSGEYYYFSITFLILNQVGILLPPLVRNDDWGGGGFNLTGWAGETGNGEIDKNAIGDFTLNFL